MYPVVEVYCLAIHLCLFYRKILEGTAKVELHLKQDIIFLLDILQVLTFLYLFQINLAVCICTATFFFLADKFQHHISLEHFVPQDNNSFLLDIRDFRSNGQFLFHRKITQQDNQDMSRFYKKACTFQYRIQQVASSFCQDMYNLENIHISSFSLRRNAHTKLRLVSLIEC